jgi:hypothetical protein
MAVVALELSLEQIRYNIEELQNFDLGDIDYENEGFTISKLDNENYNEKESFFKTLTVQMQNGLIIISFPNSEGKMSDLFNGERWNHTEYITFTFCRDYEDVVSVIQNIFM